MASDFDTPCLPGLGFANCIPIAQTGGAAFQFARDIGYKPPADVVPLDFVALLYR